MDEVSHLEICLHCFFHAVKFAKGADVILTDRCFVEASYFAFCRWLLLLVQSFKRWVDGRDWEVAQGEAVVIRDAESPGSDVTVGNAILVQELKETKALVV